MIEIRRQKLTTTQPASRSAASITADEDEVLSLDCWPPPPARRALPFQSQVDAYREWKTCYKIIKGICEGIQYLHENRIIHLDLKPANILLDDNMVPRITDFGLSRYFDENQSRDITKNISGTMGYLAPELCKGGVIARSADLYSLGVIVIEILTGQKGYQSVGDARTI